MSLNECPECGGTQDRHYSNCSVRTGQEPAGSIPADGPLLAAVNEELITLKDLLRDSIPKKRVREMLTALQEALLVIPGPGLLEARLARFEKEAATK